MNHSRPVSAEAGATIELLKVLLKASAAKHRVAPRLIADAEELERIAAEDEPDVLALKGWRRQLFGEDALKLKRGQLALTLAGGEVMVLSSGDKT
jgi:ribonuclease D